MSSVVGTVPRDNVLERMRRGDASALDALMQSHWASLVRYVRGMLTSTDGAEDIAQETFVRLWERRRRWNTEDPVEPLIYRIARNLALNELRRSRTRARLSGEVQVEREGSGPAEALERKAVLDAVRRALEKLSPRRREVFVHARLNGLSYHEIAELMDISPQTVANQMSAALAQLRNELRSALPDISSGDAPDTGR